MLVFPLVASVVLFLFAWRMDVLGRPYVAGAFVLAGGRTNTRSYLFFRLVWAGGVECLLCALLCDPHKAKHVATLLSC
jgi:hypothetical protein